MKESDESGASLGYLETLDALLALGLSGMGPDFTARQVNCVKQFRTPEGGYRGREGGADLYYTDFALRALDLHGTDAPDYPFTARWVSRQQSPRDVVDVFGLLNAARLLEKRGYPVDLNLTAIQQTLATHALPGGGYTRSGASGISVYATFLAALSCEMLTLPLYNANSVRALLLDLQRPNGGFAESPAGTTGQTNATAGALGVLTMLGAAAPATTEQAAAYLITMQAPDGGLRAHADAPTGDLLSTFTGSLALFGLEALGRLDLRLLGRFVRDLSLREGGFRGFPGDVGTDVEYTYYGMGTLAILQAYVIASE